MPPWSLTALLAVAYLLATPATTDLAAQEHRVALARDGAWILDLSWFGGHLLPSYSVLAPALGVLVGAAGTGVVGALLAAWAFGRLARRAWPTRAAAAAAWWFAAGAGALLFTGRATFLLGAGVALAGLLAVAAALEPRPPRADAPPAPAGARGARRPALRAVPVAVLAGALTAATSPVAALFLALAALAWALGTPLRGVRVAAASLAATAIGAAVALAAAFPGGGSEPFVASALWPAVAALGVAIVVLPREERVLRAGAALYLAAVLLSGAVDTPMGGNATRLAALVGGPLLAGALLAARSVQRDGTATAPRSAGRSAPLAGGGPRAALVALLLAGFLYWQWYPPVRDATQAWADPSSRTSYWAPLVRELDRRVGREPARVEVPPTVRRGEARRLSPRIPLARGWIRQLDRHRNPLFYDDRPLTASRYRRWLDEEAVAWVALPDAEPDYASRDEVALLRDPRARRAIGLREVWRDRHWVLWRTASRPLVRPVELGWAGYEPRPSGREAVVPRVVALTADRVVLRNPDRWGELDLRVRWSRFLAISGDACIAPGPGGWTRVLAGARREDPTPAGGRRPSNAAVHGTVTVRAGLPGRWRRTGRECDR
ncbi:hypothetical protein SK069_11715 [Patulibacter brassicae]|uniref:MFS transporter n=1 Tax=Patulibacter brassicae TaxID=1705717 RepID=A0ABU4VMU1_9ACTN|nr:hypothetical protein [Patulibacter brassicae]